MAELAAVAVFFVTAILMGAFFGQIFNDVPAGFELFPNLAEFLIPIGLSILTYRGIAKRQA